MRMKRMQALGAAMMLVLGTGLAVAAPPQAIPQPEPVRRVDAPLPAGLQDFDAFVQGTLKAFDVPGISVAIVKDGQVVLERGYGVRERATNAPADAHTLYAIASNTKAFTAASLQMLADDGKLQTTDRVIDHLPWFRMSDPYITNDMRIRDLLAHRSGLSLGAGDLLYWPTTDYSNAEVAKRLKDVPITGQFRAQYAYDNILFGIAQLVVEQASGMPYDRFLQQRIFDPLGMSETRYNSDHLDGVGLFVFQAGVLLFQLGQLVGVAAALEHHDLLAHQALGIGGARAAVAVDDLWGHFQVRVGVPHLGLAPFAGDQAGRCQHRAGGLAKAVV